MTDSLFKIEIEKIGSLQDSTIKGLSKLGEVVSELKSENLFIKSLPLIGVIIGGVITWVVQKKLKDREVAFSILKESREVKGNILSALTTIQFLFKELAYLEVDSKYQYHIYCSDSSSEEEKKRAFEEHYNDYKYLADIKSKIADCVAEITSSFSIYFKLNQEILPTTISNALATFTNHILTLRREQEFCEEVITVDILTKKNNDLYIEYIKHLNTVKNHADSL